MKFIGVLFFLQRLCGFNFGMQRMWLQSSGSSRMPTGACTTGWPILSPHKYHNGSTVLFSLYQINAWTIDFRWDTKKFNFTAQRSSWKDIELVYLLYVSWFWIYRSIFGTYLGAPFWGHLFGDIVLGHLLGVPNLGATFEGTSLGIILRTIFYIILLVVFL